MIRFKKGITISTLRPPMVLAALTLDAIFAEWGAECVITSGDDGTHAEGSLHYKGAALDFRTRDLDAFQKDALAERAREMLGENFDVVLESTHLHVEYDPK